MSGPTIRINESHSFPEISASHDTGNTIEVSNMNDFDLGMLGNQRKLPNVSPHVESISEMSGNDIEFVNLEDTNVTFDVKPPVNTGASDTIRILRDGAMPPAKPIAEPTLMLNPGPQTSSANLYNSSAPSFSPTAAPAFASAPASAPAPAAAKSWFSSLTGSSATSEASGIRSWFGGGGAGASSAPAVTNEPMAIHQTYLSPEQESAKKSEGLTLLERMDRKGVGGTKMTTANTLEEINAEVAKRKDSKGLEASIRFQRSMLTTVTSGMEFLNNRYDPLGVALDGWSEQVNENLEDYDEIFEELYDKYKDKSKVAPEVRLIMSLGLSAAMCHVTNTMFKSRMPGMDDILRKNPELAKQMARAAAEQAVGPGFANFVSMGMPSGPQQQGPPSHPSAYRQSQPSRTPPMEEEDSQGMFMPPIGSGISAPIPNLDPRGGVGPATARREMRGPSGVDDILNTLQAAGNTPSRSVPSTSGIDADDIASVGSGMTTETMRRAGLNRRRKATTTQPTGATLTLNV
jgi:hypothetical protein